MDNRYEIFCLADRYFYESLDRLPGASRDDSGAPSGQRSAPLVENFETAQRDVPAGWRTVRTGDWLHLDPTPGSGQEDRPLQGWKVHASAGLGNADKVAAKVWDHCVPRGIPFKFVPSPQLLHLRNSKYAGRDTSGKFVTIYPRDESQLHAVLEELGELLDGEPGPYILTDLRWREGPLYVRYGAFAKRFCVGDHGTLVSAIEDAEGHLVPDSRAPAFHVPEWVTLPDFLRPHLQARNSTTVGELPYRIESALHFSNGGGVYVGTDTRSGEKVVLKEGRPHAGLASDGADAVTRLERERDALQRLSGLGVAPEVRDWFTLGDHRFLVMEFLDGKPLNTFFGHRHPLLTPDPDPAEVADYTRWALRVHAGVERAVAAVHSRGIVFNDLHMYNIMIGDDGESVRLLDFEAAAAATDNVRQSVAHPGFMAPPDRRGTAVDHYALACLRLALFLPVTTLFAVDRTKAAHLADVIAAQFPVPRTFLEEAVTEITRGLPAAEPPVRSAGSSGPRSAAPGYLPAATTDWPAARDAMAGAILASATPDRDDRLFPGDIAQFSDGGGLGLAHGAAGVLLALAETGLPRYEDGERWLLARTAPPPSGTPLGLYDGIAGIAYALDRLGHTERALELAHLLLAEKWQQSGSDLSGGLAGIGLVLDHLAHSTGEAALQERALEAAGLVAARLAAAGTSRAGLMRGATGAALLFVRLYERIGAPALLGHAARALQLDLDRCVHTAAGGLDVDEGWRTMPYLGDGSAGIGLVLDDFLPLARRAGDLDPEVGARFEQARTDIVRASTLRLYAQPGLLAGRAGIILHLARTSAPAVPPGALAAQIDALGWYGMPYRDGLAFPGNQMMRLSMDLGTGTAGCLLALGSAHGGSAAGLPFLPPLTGGS
ncbi:class III lanthionine synthetase LanKC [Streptomyces cocklensis]|jgi:tRNA A-37 threonylcarbamoyl transferase component Bud32|uniref:non-specific serine/threonine protein kinase n=1 Tax=Actinacidiphila cocklensis TaxID=887465 RepID=A0A9W4DSG8_9ACTN|nr:class III lanthionine synthetase LanKC [Actinacidiphila cocklensis]MDD1062415.1 class III lanthionine synthetase LanKC [Actinacidiphila cocklensis]CAG6392706.1 putative SapB synthase [Actinacidiphila cocklensis]